MRTMSETAVQEAASKQVRNFTRPVTERGSGRNAWPGRRSDRVEEDRDLVSNEAAERQQTGSASDNDTGICMRDPSNVVLQLVYQKSGTHPYDRIMTLGLGL